METIIIADSALTESFVKAILETFDRGDLRVALWILVLDVTRGQVCKTIAMTQRRMIYDILARFWLAEATKVSTSLDPKQPIDVRPHCKAIEKLQEHIECNALSFDERESLEQCISNNFTDDESLNADGTTKHTQIAEAVQYLAKISRGLTPLSQQGLCPFYVRANQVLAQVRIMHA